LNPAISCSIWQKIWSLPAERSGGTHRNAELAVLAAGRGAIPGGGFGHFYNYAPVKIEYAIDRFTMEAKRLFDVLDKQLARGRYVAGEEYTIADMAIWPWFGCVALGSVYNAAEFLDAEKYTNVQRWAKDVANRHAVKRGRIVNRTSGELNEQLHERHAASDFDTNRKTSVRRNALPGGSPPGRWILAMGMISLKVEPQLLALSGRFSRADVRNDVSTDSSHKGSVMKLIKTTLVISALLFSTSGMAIDKTAAGAVAGGHWRGHRQI
jgi:hypothetical protein